MTSNTLSSQSFSQSPGATAAGGCVLDRARSIFLTGRADPIRSGGARWRPVNWGGFYDRIIATWLNKTKTPAVACDDSSALIPCWSHLRLGNHRSPLSRAAQGFTDDHPANRVSKRSGQIGMDDIAERFDRLAAHAEKRYLGPMTGHKKDIPWLPATAPRIVMRLSASRSQ